ncbi:MAG: carbohydrate kinase family protein [Fusobacteriaceae bacterium]
MSYILVFGASIVDIFGFCGTCYKQSDSIPGEVKISFGGVSRNIAENMARIGANVKFISILGDDEIGRSMVEHSKVIGYDMSDSMILKNKGTPTYMAILNDCGEMVSAVADMRLLEAMTTNFIDSKSEIFSNAEYTFLDADDPISLEYILKTYKGKTKFILDPVSSNKAKNIKHLCHYFHTIKPNRLEAEIMSGIQIQNDEDLKKVGQYFLDLGVINVFISLDADGIYYTDGQHSGKIKACNAVVKNVTGAGDSFVAGIGHGYINNLDLENIVKFSIAMSFITISHHETIHPDMEYSKVLETMDNINWEIVKY